MTEAKMKYNKEVSATISRMLAAGKVEPFGYDDYLESLRTEQLIEMDNYRSILREIKSLKHWLNTHSFRRCRIDCGLIVDYLTQIKKLHADAQTVARQIRHTQILIDASKYVKQQLEPGIPSAPVPRSRRTISRADALSLIQSLVDFVKSGDKEFIMEV